MDVIGRITTVLFVLTVVAGVAIGIMCFTGTVLAFEQEIVAWAERDARQVAVPAEATRLPLADLQRKLRETQPEFRATSVTLLKDPAAAVTFTAGRDDSFFVNPYTGEARKPASTKVHDFMHLMTDWHRYLAQAGDSRPTGKLINGVCNLAFCFLALSGLYIWMPRTWSWRGVKAIATLNLRATGKARDFNWHNVIGLWSAPILIVLTLTAVPISFRWGGNLIYTLAGEPIPPVGGVPSPREPSAPPAVELKRPSPDARPLSHDAIVASVQKDFPKWTQISLRPGGAPRGGSEGRGTPPLTITLREAGSWPRTASVRSRMSGTSVTDSAPSVSPLAKRSTPASSSSTRRPARCRSRSRRWKSRKRRKPSRNTARPIRARRWATSCVAPRPSSTRRSPTPFSCSATPTARSA
mgnify:CR=1 FL=1